TFSDELRFAKTQQFTITHYLSLAMGATFAAAKVTTADPTNFEKLVWCLFVTALWGVGLFALLNLQTYMRETRRRQRCVEQTFSPEDRKLVQAPVVRNANGLIARVRSTEPFAAALSTFITIAGLIAGYAIWQL